MENNNRRALRLPEFWVTDPVAWFAHVEAHFELENLTSQQHRYFNMVKSLSQDSLRLIKDILANPHPTTPYRHLEGSAPQQPQPHRLPEDREAVQDRGTWAAAEAVRAVGSPGGADAGGRVESKYLIFLFIQRLPKILRMQLGDDLDLDLRNISERADRLWSIHAHDMASSVAAVAAAEPADEESGQAGEPVAAIAPFHKKKQQFQQAGRRGNGAKGGSAAVPAAITGKAERLASGLCRYQWKFGEEARICMKPCSWQGN
jgi:hypothetical protein